MNQNDQMRNLAQKVLDSVEARSIKDWDCLHMYLSEAAQMARQALAAEPAPDVFELNAQIAELKTSNAKLRRIAERGAEFEAQIIKAKAQLVPEIADAHRTLAKWLNEEIDAPVDRQALAKVLAATQCLAVKECVTAQPKKLVRLTDDEVRAIWSYTLLPMQIADAIMDAFLQKNGVNK